MFEEEEYEQKIIDDYVKVHFPRECAGIEPLTIEDVKQAYQDGIEKANEWHFVKDGLPKDNEYVLIYTDLNNCYVAKKVENHFMSKGWGFIPMSTVIAWKEIVLPELPKEQI